MIERSKLGLREITREEYKRLREERGFSNAERYVPKDYGYAAISRPLRYTTEELLREVIDESSAGSVRGISYKKYGEWIRVPRKRLVEESSKIHELVQLLREQSVFYVHFLEYSQGSTDHEIEFRLYRGQRTSTLVRIPGSKRHLYNWEGSDTPYGLISGMLLLKRFVPGHEFKLH